MNKYLDRTEDLLREVTQEIEDLEWNAGDHEKILSLYSQQHALRCLVADGELYTPKF